jgi:uncharacterized membrane protein
MTKTVTFAIMHFSIAFMVTYLISGSIVLGGLIAVVEPTVNTIGYVVHEKIWQKITNNGITTHRLKYLS